MKKVLATAFLIPFIVGCTSDAEKAKSLGFSNPEQMKYLVDMGFKNYDEFKKLHPYQIKSTSNKFSESELGLNANLLGVKKEGEYGDYYLTSSGAAMSIDDTSKVISISHFCPMDSNSPSVSIDGINCNSSEADLNSQIFSAATAYCGYDSFEDIKIYYKNNAFFSVLNDGGRLRAIGVASSVDAIFPHKYFDKCSVVNAKFNTAKDAGFDSIYEMDEAAKSGIKTGQEWLKEQAKKKFKMNFDNSSNALERALVVLVSTPKEFQSHKDDGGLNVLSSWRGYQMQSAEVEYTSKVLTLFHIVVDSDYKSPNKPATVNNLKRDLIDECGSQWKPNYGGDAYFSNSEFSRCEISQARSGGYHVVVSVKSGRSD
jgi:hypothetical protein